jgi:hypothetical protein
MPHYQMGPPVFDRGPRYFETGPAVFEMFGEQPHMLAIAWPRRPWHDGRVSLTQPK